jgi:Xaa-Pro aminopeptidase
MKTMTSVLRHGRTTWDRELLPDDEYAERTRLMRARMGAAGIDVLVGLGQTTLAGDFAYLSDHVPPLNWMATVLAQEAGPLLVTGGGSRDVPFLSTQTWLKDIRTSRSLFAGPAAVIGDAIAEMAAPGARVGLAGVDNALDAAPAEELVEALGIYEVVDASLLMAELRAVKRPRELVALKDSLAIARRAIDEGLRAWERGLSTAQSLLAVEGSARLDGARDVRVLGGPAQWDLAPAVPASDSRGEDLVLQCVVEYRGYWGQACACTTDVTPANAAIDAMVDAAGAGVSAGDIAAAALERLEQDAAEIALSYGLGAGIGLDEQEAPFIVPGSDALIPSGALLALQVITRSNGRLSCADATLNIGEQTDSRW